MATKIIDEKRDAISALLYASEQQVVNRPLGDIDIEENCHVSIGSKATPRRTACVKDGCLPAGAAI